MWPWDLRLCAIVFQNPIRQIDKCHISGVCRVPRPSVEVIYRSLGKIHGILNCSFYKILNSLINCIASDCEICLGRAQVLTLTCISENICRGKRVKAKGSHCHLQDAWKPHYKCLSKKNKVEFGIALIFFMLFMSTGRLICFHLIISISINSFESLQ